MMRALKALASLKLTIACLAALMLLVVLCTAAEVSMGVYGAVRATMHSLFVSWNIPGTPWRVPLFPGGGLVGALLLANLAAAQFARPELTRRKAGLWLAHLGVGLLFLGEFLTGLYSTETQLPIEVGQTRNYAEDPRHAELVVLDSRERQVLSVGEDILRREGRVEDPRLPFALLVKRPMAASPAPGDDEADEAVIIEPLAGAKSLGPRLVSMSPGPPREFSLDGRTYRLALRLRRRYLPFSLTLKEFRHEVHPGTDIPSRFSSVLRLKDPEKGEDRDVVISMNHPLRYRGKAFYQASFGEGDRLSVLQVVENPSWTLPYLACALVGLGLLWHFITRPRGRLPEAGT